MAREKEKTTERENTKEKANKENVKEEVSHLAVKLEIQVVTTVGVKATTHEIVEENQKLRLSVTNAEESDTMLECAQPKTPPLPVVQMERKQVEKERRSRREKV